VLPYHRRAREEDVADRAIRVEGYRGPLPQGGVVDDGVAIQFALVQPAGRFLPEDVAGSAGHAVDVDRLGGLGANDLGLGMLGPAAGGRRSVSDRMAEAAAQAMIFMMSVSCLHDTERRPAESCRPCESL
jgi:hypothetical protein